MSVFTPRTLAVQAVTLSSATLSAAYYTAQAPQTAITVHGVEVAPWVIFFAVTAFALDSAKPLMMQVAGTPERGAARRLVAGLTFLVLFVGSMIAVDGMMMKLRSDWAAGRGGAIGHHKEAKKAVEELEAAMAAVGPARPVAEINAQIKAYPIDMVVWRRSKECQEISRDDTKKLCEPILALYQERGRAARRTELEPKLAEARARLAGMDPPKSADPQAEAWSRATGWDETLVAYVMVAVLGLAIEIVACFGTWIAMQPRQSGSPEAKDNEPPKAAAKVGCFETSAPKSPKGQRLTRAEVLTDLMLRAATGRTFRSQEEAAFHYGVSPSRFSEWSKDWEAEGSLPKRRMIGRCKVLSK